MKLLAPFTLNLVTKLKQGFTLIELLIVIAIIGILSGLIITNIQGVRERARDARRKSDLDAISQSLRLYYNDNQQFPDAANPGGRIVGCNTAIAPSACDWGEPFELVIGANNVVYMNRLPLDPSSTDSQVRTYTYTSANDDTFTLTAQLENVSDPDIADSQARCGTGTGTEYVVCP